MTVPLLRSNLSVLSLRIESSTLWYNHSCVIVLLNQFLTRCVVEVDLLVTAFAAGDTRYNLKSIVISEKNSISTPEHCFMYLIIPE